MTRFFVFFVTFLTLFSFPNIVNCQIISTIAGGGTLLGDGGYATSAHIYDPSGILYDKYNNLYIVTCLGTNRIRKVDTNGVITTFAGTGISGFFGDGGPATNAKLNSPVDIAIDSNKNIYFSDAANNVIRKIDSLGIISTIAGTTVAGFSGDGGTAILAKLNNPNGICFDKSGNLYICDVYNYRVRKVSSSGIISTFAGVGTFGFSGDSGPATDAQIWASTVTSDLHGNIFIADKYRIRRVDTNGIISTIAGNGISTYIGDNIPATSAQLSPDWIKMDANNNLYIGDNINYRVYKIDTGGIFHWIAGDGSTGSGVDGVLATLSPIYYPGGIAFDRCGNLIVTEINHNKIRKITYDSCTSSITYLDNQQETNNEAYIFPNPASGFLEIIYNSDSYFLIITDIFGKQLIGKQCNSHQENTDISELLPGLYYIVIIDSDNKKTVKKIIKN